MHKIDMMPLNGADYREAPAQPAREACSGHFGADSRRGVFQFQGQYLAVRNIRARLVYTDGEREVVLDLVRGAATPGGQTESLELLVEDGLVRATLFLASASDEPIFSVRAKVEAVSHDERLELQSIVLFEADFEDTFLAEYGREQCRFWRNWHDIWFPTGSMPLDGPEEPADIDRATAYHFGALYAPAERTALTFGYRMPNQWIDGLEFGEDGHLVAEERIGAELVPGRPLYSDTLSVAVGPPLVEALSQLHAPHVPRRTVEETRDHFGWNSWEAYQTRISEADVMENLEAIAGLPWLRERLRYIIIDDGWQRNKTDWEANEKFPHGMDGMAARIREFGFQPGIWTAPFLVSRHSSLLAEHPEWLLQDGDAPLTPNGETYYLDPTHPEARAYIGRIYERLYAWGYRYFKTDFLVEAPMFFVPGRKEYRETARCFDPNLGIMRGMRATMQVIRAAMGEDSFWLGCGTDIGSGAMLMDASRTGGDIAPYWTRVPNQARSVIHHFHLHGHLFLADPDFTLIKGSDTFHPEYLDVPLVSAEPYVADAWHGGRCFDAHDARTWASLVILSGGLLNLSDRIRGLNETGLSIIRTALEYAGGNAAVPLDMENSIPCVLLREEKSHYLLGLFNWDDEATVTVTASDTMGIAFPASGVVRDVWSGQSVAVDGREIAVTLPPHRSRLFIWEK